MNSRSHPLPEEFPGPDSLIGSFRRFGRFGPVYQVLETLRDEGDDVIMKVRVVDSGEEAEYKYTQILDDPKEG